MSHFHARAFLGLAILAATAANIAQGQTAYNTYANDAVTTMQSSTLGWYVPDDGQWQPLSWWPTGVATYAMVDYARLANDNSYNASVIANNFSNAPKTSNDPGFIDNYYDDDGWWALALINYYDLTGDSTYLSDAESIFSTMTEGWHTDECYPGNLGGMNWGVNSDYENAIANELFLEVAAKLANRTTGNTSSTYLNWAKEEWTWFKGSAMTNSNNLINDGLTGYTTSNPCVNNGDPTWTYNQGIILGGLVELFWADQDPTALAGAQTVAHAVLNSEAVTPYPLVTAADGVLLEPTVSGDSPEFKGIFIRSLMQLNSFAPDPEYTKFIDNNANSIWANDESTSGNLYEFGFYWQGPYDNSPNFNSQTSAIEAFDAAIAAEGRSSTGPIQTNGFGSQEMFLVDDSGNVWHNWQKQGALGASASSNWAGFNEFTMGGVVARKGAVAVMNNTYEQTVFVPSSTGDVFYAAESNSGGGWGNWTDMGSSSKGLTDLKVLNGLYGEYLFGLDYRGGVWVASLSSMPGSSWTSFTALPGSAVQRGYAVEENENGLLEVFGVDRRGTVWTDTQTSAGAWSGWSGIPGKSVQGYLAVGRLPNGALQIFGIAAENAGGLTNLTNPDARRNGGIWTDVQSSAGGSWQSGWQSLGSVGDGITLEPGFVCGVNASGILEVLAAGNDGDIYSTFSQANGGWSSWSSLGGAPSLDTSLTITTTADGRLQVFALSKAGPYDIYSNWQTSPGGSWNGWEDFDGGGMTFYAGQR